jgi:hypothetical protein
VNGTNSAVASAADASAAAAEHDAEASPER